MYLECYHAAIGRNAEIECQEWAAHALQGEELTKPRENKRIGRDGNAIPLLCLSSIAKHAPELREERSFASALVGRQGSEVTSDR